MPITASRHLPYSLEPREKEREETTKRSHEYSLSQYFPIDPVQGIRTMDDRHKPTSSTLSRIFTPAADEPRGYHLTARPGTAVPSPSSHSSSSSLSHSLSVPGPHRSKKSRRFRPEEEKEEGTEHPAPCVEIRGESRIIDENPN